jgi:hypothetical protein
LKGSENHPFSDVITLHLMDHVPYLETTIFFILITVNVVDTC